VLCVWIFRIIPRYYVLIIIVIRFRYIYIRTPCFIYIRTICVADVEMACRRVAACLSGEITTDRHVVWLGARYTWNCRAGAGGVGVG